MATRASNKFEFRNPKQIQKSNVPMFKTKVQQRTVLVI